MPSCQDKLREEAEEEGEVKEEKKRKPSAKINRASLFV